MRTRDLAQLVRFAMPMVFLVVIFGLRFPQLLSSVQGLGQGPAAAMLGLIPAWVLLFSLSISLGLSAVSLEGKSIWIYAASPNTMLRFLQGKCWSAALPTAVFVAVVAVISEILIRPGWSWAITAVLLAIAQAASVTALMVGIGAVFARFDWTDARRMMHPAGIFIGMMVFGIITGASALLLGISLALASVTHFPVITTWLAALTVAIGGGIALAALALLAGNDHLRGLEVG
jgi:Putative ATP-binding cassette